MAVGDADVGSVVIGSVAIGTAIFAAPADPVPPSRAAVLPPTAGLPLSPVFLGRDDPVERLVAHLAADRLTLVTGPPGVGKTELVRQVAHDLRDTYQSLVVDMLGWHREPPVRRVEAYRPLLHKLGVDVGQIPPTADAQEAVYFRILAEAARHDRPLLLVLDNVADAAEIIRLLPPAPHRTIVTSRHELPLDCAALRLGPLGRADAIDVVDGVLRRTDPADDRVTADRSAAVRLTDLCGCLPLALRVAAALLRRHRERSVAALVGALADVKGRLAQLDDGQGGVAAAIELSVRRLPADAAALFTVLALDPGPTVSTGAVAALADCTAAEAVRRLDTLLDHNLIGRDGDRWRMHDLIRCRAVTGAERLPGGPRRRAVDRLLRYYTTEAQAYATRAGFFLLRHTRPGPRAAGTPKWSGRRDALAWFAAEEHNLRGCVDRAFEPVPAADAPWLTRRSLTRARQRRGLRLVDAMAGYLRNDGPWEEAERLHGRAADVARALGDRRSRGIALNDLGIIRRLRCGDTSRAALDAAIGEFRGWSRAAVLGRANARNETGIVLTGLGHHDEAVDVLKQALAGYRAAGDAIGAANAAKNLGVVLYLRGGCDADCRDVAVRHLDQASAGYAAIGDLLGVAEVANHLGRLHLLAGQPDAARRCFADAGREAWSAASRWEQAKASEGLGDCAVDVPAALAAWRRAAAQYAAIGADRDERRVRLKLTGAT